MSGWASGSRAAAALLAVAVLLPARASSGPLDPPVTSCGGAFSKGQPAPDDDGYCELDFAGFPIRVEGSWTFDQPKANPAWTTDIHVEIVIGFGSRRTPTRIVQPSTRWECMGEDDPTQASCEATYFGDAPVSSPVGAGAAAKLQCFAHRHSPASYPGSGTFRCSSGAV